jgi:hypothetical protein
MSPDCAPPGALLAQTARKGTLANSRKRPNADTRPSRAFCAVSTTAAYP